VGITIGQIDHYPNRKISKNESKKGRADITAYMNSRLSITISSQSQNWGSWLIGTAQSGGYAARGACMHGKLVRKEYFNKTSMGIYQYELT